MLLPLPVDSRKERTYTISPPRERVLSFTEPRSGYYDVCDQNAAGVFLLEADKNVRRLVANTWKEGSEATLRDKCTGGLERGMNRNDILSKRASSDAH
jgi:hypothetical protein